MSEGQKELSRRDFLEMGAAAGTLGRGQETEKTAIPDFEIAEATVAQLQADMKAGKYTSERLVELYLERIEALDQRGPAINNVLETNLDALQIARKRDAER